MLTITQFGEGKCIWCCSQTTEGVHARFQDSLAGYLCKKDFWAAMKARAESRPENSTGDSSRKKE